MCLRFVFLLITRVASWLRLSRRKEAWQTAEILVLRHQPAVLQRQPRRPELNWADRALLATLLDVIPRAQRQGLRLLVTPDTGPALAPRHRPRPLGGAVHARKDRPAGDPPEHQGPGPPASRGEPRMGIPQDPRGTGWPGSAGGGVDGVGDSEECRNRPSAATDRACLVTFPAFPGAASAGWVSGLTRRFTARSRRWAAWARGWLSFCLFHLSITCQAELRFRAGHTSAADPGVEARGTQRQPGVNGRQPGDAASAPPAAPSARLPPACQPAGP